MPALQIGDLSINFPYEPYKCQEIYMTNVIECLEKGYNGALESPTGTGKTLCLLCACLSWLEMRKKKLSQDIMTQNLSQNPTNFGQNPTNFGQNPTNFGRNSMIFNTGFKKSQSQQKIGPVFQNFRPPKIIYTSRTHSQLSQVIKELNKTQYKNVTVCYFGSRDKLCIHEDVRKEENNNVKNNLCRAKIQSRGCPFYWGLNDPNSATSVSLKTEVVDIEEFISLGRKHKFCPFFKYREQSDTADLILMPYNYVLDQRARRANKIDLENSILIFDEAHNLESICEDSASVSFSSKDLAGCLKECKQALSNLMAEEEEIRKTMDESMVGFGKADYDDSSKPDINTKELAHLILLLTSLEEKMDLIDFEKLSIDLNFNINNNNDKSKKENLRKIQEKLPGKILPASFLLDLLNKTGLNSNLVESILSLVDKISSYLAQKSANSLWQSKGVYLHKLTDFLCTVHQKSDKNVFKVYLQHDQPKKATGQLKVDKLLTKCNNGVILNYWCFNASVSLDMLKTEGIRSIIVTSGTLSPLNRFIEQLGMPFEVLLENDHVINPSQVCFNILRTGPDSNSLSASFDNRNNQKYLNSLANALINLLRNVPEGLLVFFGSYSHMETCLEFWKSTEIWTKMNNLKTICVEPKCKEQFQNSVQSYANLINDKKNAKGAAFFAVCRGKLSEGVDFADNAGRAVVLVGIPYPPLMDPKVILKQFYLNENTQINGSVWYNTEAIRTVNQAMGRVIRHKNDYGAIILADERFSRWDRENFPKWLRSFITPQNFGNKFGSPALNFGQNLKQIIQFFKQHNQKSSLNSILNDDNLKMNKADIELKRKIFVSTSTSIKKSKIENDEFSDIFKTDYNENSESNSPCTPVLFDSQPSSSRSAIEAFELEALEQKSNCDIRKCDNNNSTFQKSDSGSNSGSFSTWKQKKLTLLRQEAVQKKLNLKPESVDKLGNYMLDVKAALPSQDFTKFYQICKKYKQDKEYEPFIMELKRIFLPNFIDLFKRFQGCCLNAEDRKRFSDEISTLP